MRPVRLAPNLVEHFYRGGAKIAALRGIQPTSERQPEEWIAATVCRAGENGVGLARTTEGDLLRDLVAADPVSWVGAGGAPDDVAGDTGILVKLLDAGQRLPVHVHPDRDFARRHLSCSYGKTEAWFVLDSTDDGAVYLGWTDDIAPDELAARRDAQDSDWLLGHLNRIEVAPGDGVLVPAGTAHAIGQGVFLTEVQEPTDFSILLEWSVTTSTREESHLGLGFETAMAAVSHDRLTAEAIADLRVHHDLDRHDDATQPLLPRSADPYFRLDLLSPAAGSRPVPAAFAALVALGGAGSLHGADGALEVSAGEVVAVPAAFGDWRVVGDLQLLVARPGRGWRGLP